MLSIWVALVMKRIASYSKRRLSNAVLYVYVTAKDAFTCYILLTRQREFVFKVGV